MYTHTLACYFYWIVCWSPQRSTLIKWHLQAVTVVVGRLVLLRLISPLQQQPNKKFKLENWWCWLGSNQIAVWVEIARAGLGFGPQGQFLCSEPGPVIFQAFWAIWAFGAFGGLKVANLLSFYFPCACANGWENKQSKNELQLKINGRIIRWSE